MSEPSAEQLARMKEQLQRYWEQVAAKIRRAGILHPIYLPEAKARHLGTWPDDVSKHEQGE